MAITTLIVGKLGYIVCKPSMADDMVIGGVMIPSASNAQPPKIAGTISHLALLRTNENKENMPPSPLLSACSVIITYFIVVCRVNVQKIHETPPKTNDSLMAVPPTMALKTYNGEVPISP